MKGQSVLLKSMQFRKYKKYTFFQLIQKISLVQFRFNFIFKAIVIYNFRKNNIFLASWKNDLA